MRLSSSPLRNVTDYIRDCTAVAEPPIGESVAKIDTIPRQVRLGKAPGEPVVVADIRERVAKNELHNLAIATINGSP